MTIEHTLFPMLAESVAFTELARYVKDDDWVGQLKADGHRVLIHIEDGQVSPIGRNGQAKTGITHKLLGQFERFDKGTWMFDGEVVDGRYLLFDMPQAGNLVNADTPFRERYDTLAVLHGGVWKPDPDVIGLLPIYVGTAAKLGLVQAAADERREGVMLRHVQARYQWGGRSRQLLKCKFVKECDAIVTAVGVDGKENVELSLLDPDNNRVVNVGRASAIGKKPTPQPMDVWEVRFLYVVDHENPRLYQPRLMRKRDDKAPHECLFSQLDTAFTDKLIDLEKTREDM